jgi:zinc/manganese transport system ATP-binding protein
MNGISVKNLKAGYDEHIALEDVSFEVRAPFFTTIIGPNGAGKTTLLKSLLGMVRRIEGEVRVFDIDPFERPNDVRDVVGYVPQKERIYAPVPIRVEQVVMMGLMLHRPFPRIHMKKDRERVEWALEKVGLQGFGERAFHELSGGQQQRVLIARAIVRKPSLLLLDEPFSGVDAKAQFSIVELLYSFKKSGISVMIVTHDVNTVSSVSDSVLVLNRRLLAFGTPNEVLSDRSILEQVYGPAIKIFHGTPCPSVILGDHHA